VTKEELEDELEQLYDEKRGIEAQIDELERRLHNMEIDETERMLMRPSEFL
jgi:cell division septum initiation protein DivIVA